jgi:hypothetical protein
MDACARVDAQVVGAHLLVGAMLEQWGLTAINRETTHYPLNYLSRSPDDMRAVGVDAPTRVSTGFNFGAGPQPD